LGDGIRDSSVVQQIVILMTIFIDSTGYAMVRPLFSFYVLSFDLGAVALSLLIIIFALMRFIFSPILGRLSDKYGRRSLLLISISISSFSFVLFTFASTYWMLLLSRMISGIATEVTIAQAYIADITTGRSRAAGLGKVRAAFSAGVIIGPSMGGFLTIFGYWCTGVFAIILTIINFVSVYFFLPEPERKIVEVQIPQVINLQRNTFGKNLKKSFKKPLLPSLLIILFIVVLAFSTVPVLIPLVAIEFFNLNEIDIAFVFMALGGFQFITQGFLMGVLSEKVGERALIVIGIILVIMGSFWMPLIPNLIIFYVLVGLLSMGNGFVRTSIFTIISKISSEDEQGGFLGVAQSVVSFGFIPGPLIAGFFYDYVGMAAPFFFGVLILLASLILSVKVHHQLGKQ
jgi:DHA1 family tetracycline resistance protein-like MFS transporter